MDKKSEYNKIKNQAIETTKLESLSLDTSRLYVVQRVMDATKEEFVVCTYNDYIYQPNDIVIVWYCDHWEVCQVIMPTYCNLDKRYGIIMGRINRFEEKILDIKQELLKNAKDKLKTQKMN